MKRDVTSEVCEVAVDILALDDPKRTLSLKMNLHIGELEHDFADSIGVPVELFIWTAQYHLVQELPHELVSLFKPIMSALRTAVSDPRLARPAQSLIALQAIVRIRHQVEADRARQGLLEEFVRAVLSRLLGQVGALRLYHELVVRLVLLHADERVIGQVARPLQHTTGVYDEHLLLVLAQGSLLQPGRVVLLREIHHLEHV